MNGEIGENIRAVRIGICAAVFIELLAKPQRIPNVKALITKAMYVYNNGDYEQTLEDLGYRWRLNSAYLSGHFKAVQVYLAVNHKKHLDFVRDDKSGFGPGTWKFAEKNEHEKCRVRSNNGISTLTTHHNELTEAGNEHWTSLHLPILKDVPLLTYSSN